MYYLNEGKSITKEMLEKYIDSFKTSTLSKLERNERYYNCKNDKISNRAFADLTKPNNKIATPWANYISTLISGYFMGKPLTLESTDKEMLEKLEYINKNNDAISKNQQIELDASIYGYGAELFYIGEDKQIYFEVINPKSIIPIYSTSITNELLYCIRFYTNKDILTGAETTSIEIYNKNTIQRYESNLEGFFFIREEAHYFGEVPINIYFNNKQCKGDFENVIELINGYDLSLSDTANFREELNDSYLVFKNTNLENEDILTMKERKIIQIEDSEQGMQSSIQWLNKDSNDVENENYKNRLAEDIKKFSFVSDIETAKSHTTATSAKIGLMGIEQICSNKESHFRKAILRRYEIIINVLNLLGEAFDINNLTVSFVRNIPIDLSLVGDSIAKLSPFISKETLLSQIPFVNDIPSELAKIQQDRELNSYQSIFNNEEV
jgi:SPP1 family phage portal protein